MKATPGLSKDSQPRLAQRLRIDTQEADRQKGSPTPCVLQNGRNTLFRREGRLREGEREWKRVRDERESRFECLKQY